MHYGGMLSHFYQGGCRVAGTDYDEKAIAFARDHLEMEDAFVGPSTELLELGAKPDLLMYLHVIEHINDLDGEFRVMRKILDEGGFLFLSVPGATSWPVRQGNDLLNTLQLAHTHYFNLSHLEYIAAKYGFRLVKGDDEVNALFRKESKQSLTLPVPDEYEHILRELKWIDRAWKRSRTLRKMKQFIGLK